MSSQHRSAYVTLISCKHIPRISTTVCVCVCYDWAVQNEAGPTQREAIILHPGSSYLYVGFASDSAPQAIPHLIAYHQSGPRDPQQTNDAENPSLVLEYKTEITVSEKS